MTLKSRVSRFSLLDDQVPIAESSQRLRGLLQMIGDTGNQTGTEQDEKTMAPSTVSVLVCLTISDDVE